MKTGLSDAALNRMAQYWEDQYEEFPGSQDVPREKDVEQMRTDETHPMYDEDYHSEVKDSELQADADTLYKYAYEGLAEALAGPGYKGARGRVWDMIMEDPESFLRKAFGEIRLYEE